MDLKIFYERVGGSYGDMFRRLPSEERIRKFLGRFLEDGNFSALCEALQAGDIETAFRSAHTLKGICMNLGLSRLQESSGALTENLRPRRIDGQTEALLERTKLDYEEVRKAVLSL